MMKRFLRWLGTALLALGMGACAVATVEHTPADLSAQARGEFTPESPRRLMVFLDGTANAESSYTNVARLRNMVSLQGRSDIFTVYIEGVGADGNVLGMAMGAGFGRDVRQAYAYLLEHYRGDHGDSIDLFGFSRGAYAARALAGFLEVAGLPRAQAPAAPDLRRAWVEQLYAAYKGQGSVAQRRARVALVMDGVLPTPVRVRFAGLWDTVEALGVPDYQQDVQRPNPRYIDQMCNADTVAHALSIDDDRARIFTPILFTTAQIQAQCGQHFAHPSLEQVWFSGAHADVGGGYRDGFLSGVSLQWMLDQMRPYGVLPAHTQVLADAWGPSHQPDHGLWGLIYHRQSRDLARYKDVLPAGQLVLHPSVFARLGSRAWAAHEFDWLQHFPACVHGQNGALRWRHDALLRRECFVFAAAPPGR
jgi:hypothetical protein